MTEFSIGERPVPEPDERSRPFFEATLREELLLQHCGTCGRWTWPVKERCIDCLADDLRWEAGVGSRHAVLVHARAPARAPGLQR